VLRGRRDEDELGEDGVMRTSSAMESLGHARHARPRVSPRLAAAGPWWARGSMRTVA
jgi:hypothetical protein